MAQTIIDLSGRSGLANLSAGDTDMITPQPNLRYDVKEGELVQGLFNPYLRQGYLAPVTTTLVSLTADFSPSGVFSAGVQDAVTGSAFFSDSANSIYKLDTIIDNSFTRIQQLASGSKIQDLEIYTLDNQRNVFLTYTQNNIYLNTSLNVVGD